MRCAPLLLLTALLAGADPVLDENQPYRTQVTVRNPYDRAVRIERLDSTCTCTHLKADRTLILPGDSATLSVEIDNNGKSGHQLVTTSVYLSDPEFEPIDVALAWTVRGAVTVDALPPRADPRERPEDRAWRDIARFLAHERPDEQNRLLKRVRLGSDLPPPGGLQVLEVVYPGTIWSFTTENLGNGAWLVTGKARNPDATGPEGSFDETVTVRTNHPMKPTVSLTFSTILDRKAGSQPIDPLAPLP